MMGEQQLEQDSISFPDGAVDGTASSLAVTDSPGGDPFQFFVGCSESIARIKQLVEKVSDSELSILVRGESGTGKEVVARVIHQLSSRNNGPFVKVNCAALSESLLESELFGHEKGAFTGAHKSRPGRFELAHRGTIFLDEIGDMAYNLQAKSLQVLEQKEFMPVGSTRLVRVDVRIVSATNGMLEEFIENRAFRKDLLYRLNDVTITLPPLRERREDIPELANFFLSLYSRKYRRPPVPITLQQMAVMKAYDWPGNVRQLESLVKKLTILGDEKMVETAILSECGSAAALIHDGGASSPSTEGPLQDEVPAAPDPSAVKAEVQRQPWGAGVNGRVAENSSPERQQSRYQEEGEIIPLKEATAKAVRETEIDLLDRALLRSRWNRREAAKMLQISYRSLLYKIKEYDLADPKHSRGSVGSGDGRPAEEVSTG